MIRLKLFGKFGDIAGASALAIPSSDMFRIADVYQYLEATMPELHRQISAPQVLVALNQHIVSLDAQVQEGDEVAILPPVTGG